MSSYVDGRQSEGSPGSVSWALTVLLILAAFAGGGMRGMGQMMGSGMFGLLFMGLFWILVIALIIGLVVLIVNLSNRR